MTTTQATNLEYQRLCDIARGLLEPAELGVNYEYERGMVELIMDATGRTSDDKEQILLDIYGEYLGDFITECREEAAQMWFERHPCIIAPAGGAPCGLCITCTTWKELGRNDV